MPYKDPENQKKFYQERREHYRIYQQKYRANHKKEFKAYGRKYAHSPKGQATLNKCSHLRRIRQKAEVEQILGTKCFICNNNTRMIHYHEVHGIEHTLTYSYILHHIKDFMPLCCRCHNVVHYLLNLGKKKEEILRLVKQMIN